MPENFKKAPSEYTLDRLYLIARNGDQANIAGTDKWVPARPEGTFYLRGRIEKAWKVFTGRADIVVWPGDQ